MDEIRIQDACKYLGTIHPNTLKNYERQRLIKIRRDQFGTRVFNLEEIESIKKFLAERKMENKRGYSLAVFKWDLGDYVDPIELPELNPERKRGRPKRNPIFHME